MNRCATERRRIRRNSIVQQLQQRNQGLEDTLERIQIELNLNRKIIDELLADNSDDNSEEYSTSAESLEISSVEIIAAPQPDRKLSVRPQVNTVVERKESFEKARAWALDRAKDKDRKRK